MANIGKNGPQNKIRFKHRAQGPKSSGYAGPVKPRKTPKPFVPEREADPLLVSMGERVGLETPTATEVAVDNAAGISPALPAAPLETE